MSWRRNIINFQLANLEMLTILKQIVKRLMRIDLFHVQMINLGKRFLYQRNFFTDCNLAA